MTRRTLTTIALAALLLPASSAAAAAAIYEGEGTDDPKAKVRFERDSGKIKGFKVEGAKFRCTDGPVFRDGTRVGPMDIRRTRDGERRFSGDFRNADGDQTANVRGRLIGDRRARGRFRLIAVFPKGACDTGTVSWTARTTSG